jgi:hypothetical protein
MDAYKQLRNEFIELAGSFKILSKPTKISLERGLGKLIKTGKSYYILCKATLRAFDLTIKISQTQEQITRTVTKFQTQYDSLVSLEEELELMHAYSVNEFDIAE